MKDFVLNFTWEHCITVTHVMSWTLLGGNHPRSPLWVEVKQTADPADPKAEGWALRINGRSRTQWLAYCWHVSPNFHPTVCLQFPKSQKFRLWMWMWRWWVATVIAVASHLTKPLESWRWKPSSLAVAVLDLQVLLPDLSDLDYSRWMTWISWNKYCSFCFRRDHHKYVDVRDMLC